VKPTSVLKFSKKFGPEISLLAAVITVVVTTSRQQQKQIVFRVLIHILHKSKLKVNN